MKDNFPNYLNPHNIDPGRVEPAHIDNPPGFDSIRPGQKIGTVGLVGRGHPKLHLPTISNTEAIRILEKIETDIYGKIAIGKAIDALQFNDTSAELTDSGRPAHSHSHTLHAQPDSNEFPKAVCPKCGKYMTETGSFPAGVIQCDLHHWKCDDCNIKRRQAHDWLYFQPREWHRPRYSIRGGDWIGEDEPEKLKAALDALPPLPKVNTPFGFERIGEDWEETAE